MASAWLLCSTLRPKGRCDIPMMRPVLLSSCFLVLLVVSGLAQGCDQTPSDCIAGETTFDPSTNCCKRCSLCQDHIKMYKKSLCNVTHDAVCDCRSPTYLDPTQGICSLQCSLCPTSDGRPGSCVRSTGTERCLCPIPACHLTGDIYCDNPIRPPCRPTVPPATTTLPERPRNDGLNQDQFPSWGIGLIAVGIVIGIIIFASCFLFMGIFTMHRNSDPESQRGSESSENGLVHRDSFSSVGTKSSFMSASSSVYPYLSNHDMLELLKNSNSQMMGSKDKLSSTQSSPVSTRSSPKPGNNGTTIRLAKNSTTDKLTAVIL